MGLVDHESEDKEIVAEEVAETEERLGHFNGFLDLQAKQEPEDALGVGTGPVELGHGHWAAGQDKSMQAVGSGLLVGAVAGEQPLVVFLRDGATPADGAVEMVEHGLEPLQFGAQMSHGVGQLGEDPADLAAEIIR